MLLGPGTKQGQDVYLAGPSLPSFQNNEAMQTRFSPRCSRPTSAEAVLIIDVN
jgi:hypothetical protein